MEQPTLTWIELVKSAVTKLQTEYHEYRGMLLTEGDLECHMFNKLINEEGLSGFHNCKNDTFHNHFEEENLRTSFVHSQVTWFKPDKKSGFEVDLTIGDPAKLEVKNIELFEQNTSKGFAYDGPCIAIELKFIRDISRANILAQEDFLKLRDNLIPVKTANIKSGMYKNCSMDNVAFITIVGCKDKDIFEHARHSLAKHISDANHSCPDNLLACIFYQDEIIWGNGELCSPKANL